MKKRLLVFLMAVSLHADTEPVTDELNRGFSYIGVLLIVLIVSVWAIFFISNRGKCNISIVHHLIPHIDESLGRSNMTLR
jgi:competence protein ComGC